MLWERRFAKFRRQVSFARYVVDFYCHAVKLVIEIDGNHHDWVSEYDVGRAEGFERMGVRVIRVTNEQVCGDLDAALARIYETMRLPF